MICNESARSPLQLLANVHVMVDVAADRKACTLTERGYVNQGNLIIMWLRGSSTWQAQFQNISSVPPVPAPLVRHMLLMQPADRRQGHPQPAVQAAVAPQQRCDACDKDFTSVQAYVQHRKSHITVRARLQCLC